MPRISSLYVDQRGQQSCPLWFLADLTRDMFRLSGYALMVASWLVSDHYPPWTAAYNDTVMAAGLALLFAVTAGRQKTGASRLVPVTFWWLVAISLIPAFQWLAGQLAYGDDVLVAGVYVLGLAVAILTGQQTAARNTAESSAALLGGAILLGAGLSASVAVMQSMELGSLGHWTLETCVGGRACANLSQPNNLGTLLGLGVLGVLLLREQSRLSGCTAGVLLTLLLLGAAASQSRTAMLYGPTILIGLWVSRRAGIPIQTSMRAVAFFTAAHWLLAWAWPLLQEALLLHTTPSFVERSIDAGRMQAWGMFVDALSLCPWAGFGWLQTANAQLMVAENHPALTGVWQQAHNLFLELLLWCGYPLGLGLCGLIVFWCINRARRVASIEGVVGMLAVALFGIHSMLELPYHYAYFLIPIGMWIGIVEHETSATVQRWASLRWIPVGLSVMLAVAVMYDYVEVEEDFRLARFEALRVGTRAANTPAPKAHFLPSLTGYLLVTRTRPAAGMSANELTAMEASVRRYPHAASMAKLAFAWALNGRAVDAKQMFSKIRYVHGERMYGKVRRDLHELVLGGEVGLLDLDSSFLP